MPKPKHRRRLRRLHFRREAKTALAEHGLTWDDVHWYQSSRNGRVTRWGKIAAPVPADIERLYVLIHELGHHQLHMTRPVLGKPELAAISPHVREYDAEHYAHKWFAEHGIAVPAALTQAARAYVRVHVENDIAHGIVIEPAVAIWAGMNPRAIPSPWWQRTRQALEWVTCWWALS